MAERARAVPNPTTSCPVCDGPNGCVPAASGRFDGAPCWCTTAGFSPALLGRVPQSLRGKACVCGDCASASIPAKSAAPP